MKRLPIWTAKYYQGVYAHFFKERGFKIERTKDGFLASRGKLVIRVEEDRWETNNGKAGMLFYSPVAVLNMAEGIDFKPASNSLLYALRQMTGLPFRVTIPDDKARLAIAQIVLGIDPCPELVGMPAKHLRVTYNAVVLREVMRYIAERVERKGKTVAGVEILDEHSLKLVSKTFQYVRRQVFRKGYRGVVAYKRATTHFVDPNFLIVGKSTGGADKVLFFIIEKYFKIKEWRRLDDETARKIFKG